MSVRETSNREMVIGEVLRRRSIITDEQLETALNVQKDKLIRRGQVVRLGHIIVELGYAPEDVVIGRNIRRLD